MFIVSVTGRGGLDESGTGRDRRKDGHVLSKAAVLYQPPGCT